MKARMAELAFSLETSSLIDLRGVPAGERSFVFSLALILLSFLLLIPEVAVAQKKRAPGKPKAKIEKPKPVDEIAKLREEFIKATNEYKASLEKLRASYEKDVLRAEERLVQSKGLFEQGLLSRKELEGAERAAAEAKEKVADVSRRMTTADSQIAD